MSPRDLRHVSGLIDPLLTGDSQLDGFDQGQTADSQLPHVGQEGGQRAVTIGSGDALRIGLALSNAMAAAVYGARGELRVRREE